MKHQPYEEWIFRKDTLSVEQRNSLQKHLQTCEHCCKIADALQQFEVTIRLAPVIAPAAGFTQRWEARLQKERLRRQRRLSYLLLLALGIGVLAIFLVMVAQFLMSPGQYIVAFITMVTSFTDSIENIRTLIRAFSLFLPSFTPILLSIGLSICLGILSILWVLSLWKVNLFQRTTHA